jgi:hypothetical protein
VNKEDVDIDKLITQMANPELGDNANSILGMMKEFNVVLNEFSKTMDFLNKYGVLVPTIRIAAAKMNVDIDKPLAGNLNPSSDWHRLLYERLNTLSPDEAIKELGKMGKKLEKTTEK